MLNKVDFCGINITRLVIGANPFGGYSHLGEKKDKEMLTFHTKQEIKKTWKIAEKAGINTMVTNNETPHVLQAVKEYFNEGDSLQWITQINKKEDADIPKAIEEAVNIGCKAVYIHGLLTEDAYLNKNDKIIYKWKEIAKQFNIPFGVAGHAPEVHYWINSLDIADFHAVCFFNCGSLHDGKGHTFKLKDVFAATECIRSISKPCIAYKIMGAGRIDPQMAFQYAFENIKPFDIINVGMHRGDHENIVEENVKLVDELAKI